MNNLKQIAVVTQNVQPFLLPLPPLPKGDPSLEEKIPETVVNSSATLDFKGRGLDQIKYVTFAGKSLPIRIADDGPRFRSS